MGSLAMPLFMDQDLARRIEQADGAINASFVEVRARVSPEVGASWRDFAGTYAMFDGVESPMTQTFGLGLFERVSAGEVAGMEAFFQQRGAEAVHEVSPLAGIETFALLAERGYRPVELSTVLARSLAEDIEMPAVRNEIRARAAEAHEAAAWIEASVAGWAEQPGMAEPVRRIASVAFENPSLTSFLVEHEGLVIATGSLGVHQGVALLAGASTLPGRRGLGAQKALLAARLAVAKERGCDMATMAAEPGSTSQRNAERNGFRVAYTRVKWKLSRADAE